jgi:putative ABC transport system permease protein
MLQDLRCAARALLKQPAFTMVAVATLALGIGVNTAVFSLVSAVLLRPLPYREPGRLVLVWDRVQRLALERGNVSPANFIDWQRQNRVFESMAAYTESFINLAVDNAPVERVYGLEVTTNLFDTLGVQPILGRGFRQEDAAAAAQGAPRPVLLSYGLWQRRFGSDPTVVGRCVALNGGRAEVLGVLPSQFLFSSRTFEVFRPLAFTQDQIRASRGRRWLTVVGRLKPNVTAAQAQVAMDVVTAQLADQYPDVNRGRSAAVRSLQEELLGGIRPALSLLQGAVGLLLLIAAANVANLQLARSLSTRREMATRLALGATRPRLVRQLMAQSLVLATMGAALGLVLARWCLTLIVAFTPASVPRVDAARLDGHVLAFALLVAGATSVLFGLLPALQASTPDLQDALKEGGRASAGVRTRRSQRMLVIAEVALSLVLLVGAGLLIKSFLRLQRVSPGFVENEAIAMDISLGAGYGDTRARARFFEELVRRVEALPGVRSAGVTKDLPLSGETSLRSFRLLGNDSSSPANATIDAECRRVSAHFFAAMGISMENGREFVATDTETAPGVVIVNEAFSRRFLPGQNALGRQLVIQDGPQRPRQIVGVVHDVKHFGLDVAAVPEMYVPHVDLPWPSMTLVVRAQGIDHQTTLAGVRRELGALDKTLPLANIRTVREYVAASTAGRRFSMRLVGAFATLALLLTALGIYGVMAYTVAQRTQEIAIRVALGAERRDILRLVLSDGFRLLSIGLALGLAVALAVGRMMTHLLYDVSAADPAVLAVVTALLGGVTLLACYVPAMRASHVEPAVCARP